MKNKSHVLAAALGALLFTLCEQGLSPLAAQTPMFEKPPVRPFGRDPFPGAQFGEPGRIPGVIQAENFDEGGEGVAFHNVPPLQLGDDAYRKLGLAYRKADTEIEIAYGTGMLAALRTGEWWKYTVNVTEEDVFDLDLVTAGWSRGHEAGKLRIEMDGKDLVGLISVPFTGQWKYFTTTTFPGIKLTKGVHEMKVTAVDVNDNVNIDLYRFRPEVTSPFNGVYQSVPGLVEAEDFVEGPEGLAFHNVDPIVDPEAPTGPRAAGLAYRKTPVELEKFAGVMMIAAVKPGEWWKYLLDVDHDGLYDVDVSVARWDEREKEGAFSFEIDNGKFRTEPIEAPMTGKWFLFRTVTVKGIPLKKGIRNFRVINEKGDQVINLDSYRFTPSAPGTEPAKNIAPPPSK